MTLTEEQAKQIKEKLLEQLSNFPQDKKEQITQQVNTMTPNQLEDFVKQNQLNHLGGQCVDKKELMRNTFFRYARCWRSLRGRFWRRRKRKKHLRFR